MACKEASFVCLQLAIMYIVVAVFLGVHDGLSMLSGSRCSRIGEADRPCTAVDNSFLHVCKRLVVE